MGTELGRYVILELRGAGGMGVVYGAYDPKLDRRVALKLLQPGASDADEAGARLLREAQALAKLAHPNVVTVHDSGMLGDFVFVEMELVEGATLGEWSKGKPWREILGAYLQAGRALAAVHGVGLVHRDFKPSNAVVDKEGRVRVLDFGVARAIDDVPPEPTSESEREAGDVVRVSRDPIAMADVAPTAAGITTGTPAYMPPEQWRGSAIDARADQYAFAVSLFHALYGVLPFARPGAAKMIDVTMRGPIAPRPAGSRVPGYLHLALVRALAFDAADRFPSMGELLIALSDDAKGRRRRRALMAVAALSALLAIGLLVRHERAREERACSATEKLAGAWDEDKQERIHAALLRSGNDAAEDVWSRVRSMLDAYATSWAQMRTLACRESRHSSRTVADAALGAKLMCLDWRLRELRGLTDVLATDSKDVHQSVDAAMGLVPVADCANPAMRDAVKPYEDPAIRSRVDAMRSKLAEVDAQRLAGRPKIAKPLAVLAVAEARQTNVRAAVGLALLALGRVQQADGDYKGAAASLEEAVWAAEASRDDPTLFYAADELAFVVGYRSSDPVAGAHWEKHASAALERVGSPDVMAADLYNTRLALAQLRKDRELTIEYAHKALELSVRGFGAGHAKVARAENNLGVAYSSAGRYDEALLHWRRAVDLYDKAVGPTHPDVTGGLTGEGGILRKRGDTNGALVLYRRALAIQENALGLEHPQVSQTLESIALALATTGRWEESRKIRERELAIRRKVYGDESLPVASVRSSLASLEAHDKKYAEARALYMQALSIQEKAGGKESTAPCIALLGLASVSMREKKLGEALERAERCHALRVKKLGPEHRDNASSLAAMARAHTALGHPERAIPMLEAAAVMDEHESSTVIATNAFSLAKALQAAKKSPARARALVESATKGYLKDPDSEKSDLDELKAWAASNAAWLASSDAN